MIIEDDKNICDELARLLENHNYQTILLKDFEDLFGLFLNYLFQANKREIIYAHGI